MIASGPLLSPWLAFPLAALTMTIIAVHAAGLGSADMPESRRTIRRINGMLMLIAVPVIAYAFSGVGADRPRAFVLVWTATTALLAIIVLVAVVDMLNTARLHRAESRELRQRIREARAQLAALASESARRRRANRDAREGLEPAD